MIRGVLVALLCVLAGTASAKTSIFNIVDTDVAGSTVDTTLTAVVPAGKSVKVLTFGGSTLGLSGNYFALQWGSAASWQTIRAAGGTFEFPLGKAFVGDGTKRFRLVRANTQASATRIVAWLEGYVDD